jgi:hypothetical protein
MRHLNAALLFLAILAPTAALAQVPVIDRAVLGESDDRADTTAHIRDVNKDRFTINQGVTCSMYRPGRSGDPVDAAHSNPEITGLVRRVAREEGIDENQFMALVYQESRFNPCAVSPAGATGLSQLIPGTAADLGVNPNNIEQNLRGGARYYKQQLLRYGGDVNLALAAYNSGPGNVNKYGGIPPFKETQGYVANITQKWLPALGGSDVSDLPLSYGRGGTSFTEMRASTLNAMATTTATSASSGNVASWLQQLGQVQTGSIQDSWDHNSSARNANLEMMNQFILLGATMADLLNSRNAMSLGDLSGSSQSTDFPDQDAPPRDTAGLCDERENLEWDDEAGACVENREEPEQVELQMVPQ